MHVKQLIAVLGLGMGLAVSSTMPLANAAPQLTVEAAEALAGAEARVAQAKAMKALWTSAEAALAQAQDAAAKGDSAAVVQFASRANAQAFLGMAQLHYPLTDN